MGAGLKLPAEVVNRDMVAVFLTTLVLALAALWSWNGETGTSILKRGTGLLLLSLYIAYYGWLFITPLTPILISVTMANQPDQFFIDSALRTIAVESSAISALGNSLDASFRHRLPIASSIHAGRVVVTGMGKSGHIAGKIAATLASTGTPAFFVHPGEASHGDMGMITQSDCVIALSNSGGTFEILTLLPLIKRLNIPLISITGDGSSELAQASDVHLLASIETEACPLNLAPTSSTTTALVMGDALAIATLEARGFTAEGICFLASRWRSGQAIAPSRRRCNGPGQ